MIYMEKNQPHYLVWPVLAFGKNDTEGIWIGIGWLNLEIGWRNCNDEFGDEVSEEWWDGSLKEKNK